MFKFYDAEKSNEFFDTLDAAITRYASEASCVLTAYAVFAGDEEEAGQQAQAAQELVGSGERNLVGEMLEVQQQLSDAGAHVRESFATDVDAAENALIETDTLLEIEEDFKAYDKTFDELGTEVEEIAAILQSRFGQYASFETPDFETGRGAFEEFCGGAVSGGYLEECIEKLEDFDTQETAYLKGLDIDDLLAELQAVVDSTKGIFASLDISDPAIAAERLADIELDVEGNIYVADATGRRTEIGQSIRAIKGDESLCEVRRGLLNAKYRDGQYDAMEVLHLRVSWGESTEEIYSLYTDDKEVLQKIEELSTQDSETGRYGFEETARKYAAGETLSAAELKALSLILENNGNITYLLFEGETAEEAQKKVETILENFMEWDKTVNREGVTDTDEGYDVTTYHGVRMSSSLDTLTESFALPDDHASRLMKGVCGIYIHFPGGSHRIENAAVSQFDSIPDAPAYLELSAPSTYMKLKIDAAGWDVNINLESTYEPLGFGEEYNTITVSHYEDWERPKLYLKNAQAKGELHQAVTYSAEEAEELYKLLTGQSGKPYSTERIAQMAVAPENEFMMRVVAPRAYADARERITRSVETGEVIELTWMQKQQMEEDVCRMIDPETVLSAEESSYAKDVAAYYIMTHPNADYVMGVYIDPAYCDANGFLTEEGIRKYPDAYQNQMSEAPCGFSVYADIQSEGYQEFLRIGLLREKTAGGANAALRGFVQPIAKVAGVMDTAATFAGELAKGVIYDFGSVPIEVLAGYETAEKFHDFVYGTEEEQRRRAEVKAATGTYNDLIYANAKTQYPVYTNRGEQAGTMLMVAASTYMLSGFGLTASVESSIAPYVTEFGKAVLPMTITETTAETIVLIVPNMDYNIKHGMSIREAANVAAEEEVFCFFTNLFGNSLGYGINNIMSGETSVVLTDETNPSASKVAANGTELLHADDIITDGTHIEGGNLKPDVTYQAGEYQYLYQTNGDGLIVHVETDNLQLKTHEGRLQHNPNTLGKLEGDQAGHLIGDRFGGSPELDNLVSQAKRVNLSEYKIVENQWERAIKSGSTVSVNIDIIYAAGSTRPSQFIVTYAIDGSVFQKIITN